MTEKRKLYRFERVEDKRLETLRNRQLFLSKPKYFNDLFDCQLRLNAKVDPLWTQSSLIAAFDALYSNGVGGGADFPLTQRMVGFLQEMLRVDDPYPGEDKFAQALVTSWGGELLSQEVSESVLACCFFSKKPTDALMWAHYGDNHHGFCVEYEVDGDPEELFMVDYSTAPPIVSATELLFSPRETMVRVLATKSIEWMYEREARILRWGSGVETNEPGKALDFPVWLRPTRLIFGARMSRGNHEKPQSERFDKVYALAGDLEVEAWKVRQRSYSLEESPIDSEDLFRQSKL